MKKTVEFNPVTRKLGFRSVALGDFCLVSDVKFV